MILELLPAISGILDRLLPNQNEKLKQQIALEIATLNAEMELAKGQLSVNAAEAASEDKYVSRWRPTAGWLCLSALAIGVLVKIVLPSLLILLPVVGYHDLATIKTVTTQLAALDIDFFNTMLWGLLGLGGMRSFEKLKGKKGA